MTDDDEIPVEPVDRATPWIEDEIEVRLTGKRRAIMSLVVGLNNSIHTIDPDDITGILILCDIAGVLDKLESSEELSEERLRETEGVWVAVRSDEIGDEIDVEVIGPDGE